MSKPSRAAADEFRDYCIELLSGIAPRGGIEGIVARRMFGGAGFSMDGKTFAIIAFDQLWLKGDDESRAAFDEAGCEIFTYESDGKTRSMGYFTVPPEAMESAALMKPWAELAWSAALRAAASKSTPKAAAKKPAAKNPAAKKPAAKKPSPAKPPRSPKPDSTAIVKPLSICHSREGGNPDRAPADQKSRFGQHRPVWVPAAAGTTARKARPHC